jgi:hypothetical protein
VADVIESLTALIVQKLDHSDTVIISDLLTDRGMHSPKNGRQGKRPCGVPLEKPPSIFTSPNSYNHFLETLKCPFRKPTSLIFVPVSRHIYVPRDCTSRRHVYLCQQSCFNQNSAAANAEANMGRITILACKPTFSSDSRTEFCVQWPFVLLAQTDSSE